MTFACGKTSEPGSDDRQQVYVQTDTCRFTAYLRVSDNISDTLRRPGSLELFVYDADGLHNLLDHRSYAFLPDSAVLYCKARNVTVVAIADSPLQFNAGALQRYDSIELLSYRFEEDSAERPVMSGQRDIEAGGSGSIILSPILARIKTGEISNKLRGYIRLENPRIYLENMNASAELLRTTGFYPSEICMSTPVKNLPYDIGVFSQSPGTELFCYPNDSPEASIGSPATAIVLECEIEGATRQFRVSLPPIKRNSTLMVDITVTGEESFESKVY